MTVLAQGGLANSSGKTLETTVVGTLASKGFVTVQYRIWALQPTLFGQELLLRNVPYTTIYGHPGKTEFLIRSARYQLNVRIECKWQQSAGSVDEKFPYLYLNCVECMPEQHIIILVDGGGAKAGSIAWLHDVCASKRYTGSNNREKTIAVMDLREFLIWANKTFR
jgi:hypothetical protein